MLALVTGISGQVGSALARRLRAEGIRVRGVALARSRLDHLSDLPLEVVRCELDDAGTITRAAQGAEWIFHIASAFAASSAFRSSGDPSEITAEVVGTESLLRAARAGGATRFVYTSSVAVYAPEAPVPVSETARLAPRSAYGRAKLLAEERVRTFAREGLDTVIVRPCIIYGPDDRHFVPTAIALARMPVLVLPGRGQQRHDLIYVEDVAELLVLAARADIAVGKTYNVASGSPWTLADLTREICLRLKVSPPRITAPASLLRAGLPLVQWYVRRYASEAAGVFTPTLLEYISRDTYYDVTRAREELAFRPRIDIERGLTLALAGV